MTENRILQAIADFIKEITSDDLLEKPNEDVNIESELVSPVVVVGYLPPKNFLPEGYDIPAVIVGMDDGEDNDQDAFINVRITIATYDPGEKNEVGLFIPDSKGYIDLLHMITKIRTAISAEKIINGATTVNKPMRWGMYEEQPWPYWYGYIKFSARCSIQLMQEKNSIDLKAWESHFEIPGKGIVKVL